MKSIEKLLREGVTDGVFTAAQAAIAVGDQVVFSAGVGHTDADHAVAVTEATLFDIASVTKIFTASAALRVIDRGGLRLADQLSRWLPGLNSSVAGELTIEALLAHESGCEAWLPLYEKVDQSLRGRPAAKKVIVEGAVGALNRVDGRARQIYSDLGFIALGEILERCVGAPLDRLIAAEVTDPLRLTSVHFRPIGFKTISGEGHIAATEKCPWRGRVLVGEVHDDNAWTMGGIAPHAGLFATAVDLARFGAAWLAAVRGGEWLSSGLARRAIARRPLGRGLGWDIKQAQNSAAGDRLGPKTFGHLGFTGTSLWVDPQTQLSVVLLTNRVHPSRENIEIRQFRPRFYSRAAQLAVKKN